MNDLIEKMKKNRRTCIFLSYTKSARLQTDMVYLSTKDVKKFAKSPKSALDVSLVHWYQNWKGDIDEASCFQPYCGLCQYYGNKFLYRACDFCPLRSCDSFTSIWGRASDAWSERCLNPVAARDWKKAARNMFYKLIRLSDYKNTQDFLTRVPQRYLKYLS